MGAQQRRVLGVDGNRWCPHGHNSNASSVEIQMYESIFSQDLNGDGNVGFLTTIESSGSNTLFNDSDLLHRWSFATIKDNLRRLVRHHFPDGVR